MKSAPTFHIFVCTGHKADGKEGICHSRDSTAIVAHLRQRARDEGLPIHVNETDCFRCGISGRGPNVVVYPQGVWYGALTVADADEIIESHFKCGQIVERLVLTFQPT
ncbi:MAG: ferredoxin [Chthoniobacteraceae bacterium]